MLLLAAATLTAAAPASEPTAWQSTSWGMNVEEIRAAFPAGQIVDRAAPPDNRKIAGAEYPTLTLPSIEIIGEQFKVDFFTEPGNLHRVNVGIIDRNHVSESLYHRLEDALALKYGRPMAHSTDTDSTSQWKTKTSVVTLHYFHARLVDYHDLFITYSPIPNDPL